MSAIAQEELQTGASSLMQATYNDQRTLISSVFNSGAYNMGSIMLRLVVIDSLYSTNAAYSYFSFEEMAQKVYALGDAEAANDYFYSVALGGVDSKQLFSESYGIQKDLREGSKQMSLLSKYAYYCLLQCKERYPLGFPIYDRLAKEAYPVICKMMGVKHISMPSLETPSIEKYIACLAQLRTEIFADSQGLFHDYQQYDILDAYLWRLGKFEGGNLSLLLGRDSYVTFVRNLGLDYATTQDTLDSNKFNRSIQERMLTLERPFRDLPNESYLNKLLTHWREYHQASTGKMPRGVPYTVGTEIPKTENNNINKNLNNHSMEIKVDGRLLVSTLCARFKEEFGGTLRVYNGNKRCDGSEKVSQLATATGSYECRASKTVGGFEQELLKQFGLKVQVASADDWVLALDEMTLSKLPEIPKNATKAQMEELKAKYGK